MVVCDSSVLESLATNSVCFCPSTVLPSIGAERAARAEWRRDLGMSPGEQRSSLGQNGVRPCRAGKTALRHAGVLL